MALIELHNIIKNYPVGELTISVLKGVSLSIEKGEYSVTVSAKKKKRPHPRGTLPSFHHADEKESLIFKGVKDGADYEYTAKENGVKENIIVKKKASTYA